MKLLIISGDRALAQGKKGPFYYMLEEFSRYWERIDIICPRLRQCFGGQAKPFVQKFFNNVYVHSSNLPKIFHPWFILKKGTEIFKEQKFDFFTTHSYPPFYNDIGGCWLHNKIKKPFILEVHHITGYPRAGNTKERFYRFLNKIFIRYSAKKAAIVRVVNQKQTPGFLKRYGVDSKKIIYAPSAYIDLETFSFLDLEKKYDLVFAGRLAKNKGINLLLEAINVLKGGNFELKTIIIGEGSQKDKIQKYIKKHNLGGNIEFSGWLQTAGDVARIYNQSKIMVMPSFNEGGPRVTLEAMACKTAVITSKVGIMLDIIRDPSIDSEQANGVFMDWNAKDIADKIKLLLDNNGLREKIVENGYQTVQQFERKKIIENYAKIFESLLHSS
ncbi:MAG TPA: glycosyltransferase family 4 protein [Candidatus Paceibacterota bacterium]|nr:glycosyltransferase family 4 protein [Candidatus Paceibacterota bacterium]